MGWERTATEAMMDITEGDFEAGMNKIALAQRKLEGAGGHEEDALRLLRHAERALFLSRTPFLATGPAAEAESDAQVAIEEALHKMDGR